MNPSFSEIIVGVVVSIIATIFILLTRLFFYKVRDSLPAGSLFKDITNSRKLCVIFIRRMKDVEQKGEFKSPLPDYNSLATSTNNEKNYEGIINTPWVASMFDSHALAHILNVLGKIGRTENIEVSFPDKDFDKWDSPMFILGGTRKAERALEIASPIYKYQYKKSQFILLPTNEVFKQESEDIDIGLLQKLKNPTNNLPIWLCSGHRGAGTTAAAYTLVRYWKCLGWLYGDKPFGLLVSFNDKDGWQQSKIISVYPKPNLLKRLFFFSSWKKINPEEKSEKEEDGLTMT